MKTMVESVQHYLTQLQDKICHALEVEDGQAKFIHDNWESALGQGSTRVMVNGHCFEKAGVNFSHVSAAQLPPAATVQRPELHGCSFQAIGISLITHPDNPFVPTTHANLRFFAAEKNEEIIWWFGGGFDLTPYYGFVEDCQHWHRTAKQACDPFGKDIYPQYKKWCDEYFYLKHRNEPRGIGGLFFDDVNLGDFETSFAFVKSVGDHFLEAYLPIVQRRKNTPFTEREKQFQKIRRGRYVEFNLVYDRGTLFGLQSGGRTESILISLPPEVAWQYNWPVETGSPEEKLYTDFLVPKDWLATSSLISE